MAVICSFVFAAFIFSTSVSAQETGKSVWKAANTDSLRSRNERPIREDNFVVFSLDRQQMVRVLNDAPMEFTDAARIGSLTFKLPTPEGRLETFRVVESPVLSPELSAEYPTWRTYQAHGVDDPSATARFGITELGFHATVLTTRGTVLIDPVIASDKDNYIVYFKQDLMRERRFHCELDEELANIGKSDFSFFAAPQFSHGSQIRTYRLAIATTGEYTQFFGGQTPALAQVVITSNRMNGVYRRDFAIGLQLVSGTNLVYPDPATDPYSNTSSSAQLTVNQNTIDSVLGSANYDVGHLFLTSDSGVAQLSSICGSSKARGLSGQNSPQGDGFDVDYVAHEIGHQIGANHTFNATGNCGSSPSNSRREPGSAVTIMGYAGICSSSANLQRNSIDNFLGHNQEEAINFINGNGSTCGTISGTNQIPVVSVPAPSYSIPFNTPYALTATATDADGDTLTYSWEHNTPSTATASYPGTPDDDDVNLGTGRVLMRPYSPTTSPTRYFPSMTYILNNANEPPVTYTGTSATGSVCAGTCSTGEDLPSVARTINYRVTVRDNNGGVADASTNVEFVNTTTPFSVTSQNTPVTYAGNSVQPVTWDVSGTTAAPINAAQVRIRFSLDGGQTFPFSSSPIPNNGTVNLTMPNVATTQGRIMVEAVGNIFFDVNNANITLTASSVVNRRAPFDFDGDDKTDLSIYRPSVGHWWHSRSSDGGNFAIVFGASTDKPVPADFTGDQKADFAFWRPDTGLWFIMRSEDFSYFLVPFGETGDVPIPFDFDGDGKADLAVFRPSNNTWYIQKSGGGTDIIGFGSAGDRPVVGDYDGDGKADIAIFRPASGQWWIRNSSDGSVFALTFGVGTDRPVPGFYTADNKTDIAIWRPTTGEWYILRSEDLSFYSFPFGTTGDVPVPGDYDGDDQWDPAVFRPSNNTWYVNRSTGGINIQGFGSAGDLPLPGVYIP